MRRTGAAAITAALLISACLALFVLFDHIERTLFFGLDESWTTVSGSQPPVHARARTITLERIPAAAGQPATGTWAGYWYLHTPGVRTISGIADDRVAVRVDGLEVLRADTQSRSIASAVLPFGRGFHRVDVQYQQVAGSASLTVLFGSRNGISQSLVPPLFFPRIPGAPRLLSAMIVRQIRIQLLLMLLGAAVMLGVGGAALLIGRCSGAAAFGGAVKLLRIAVPALIVLYAGALRFEALTIKHGQVERPAFIRVLQQSIAPLASHLHPATLHWKEGANPYDKGDPINYLRMAREMKSFYAAQFREPFYVWVTKQALRVFHGDISVSFGSGLFSVLAVLATFLLGAHAFNWWIGSIAALLLAIEEEVLSLGVDGWRDDTFMFLVLMFAFCAVRLYRKPTFGNALAAGIFAGIACLTRLTSFSFILPAYLYVLLFSKVPWKLRIETTGISLLLMCAVIAPFLINCAIVYGDPMFSVNDNTKFYRMRENVGDFEEPMTVREYLRGKLQEHPANFMDTGFVGLTAYPFGNKWKGFFYLSPDVPAVLAWLSMAGIAILIWSPVGRLLLVILFASLIPYAFTYEIPGGSEYRFTLHAYPFYLICSSAAAFMLLSILRRGASYFSVPVPRRKFACAAAASALLLGLCWLALNGLGYMRKAEAARSGDSVFVAAGKNDRFFFTSGWYPPSRVGRMDVRFAAAAQAVLHLPLAASQRYILVLGLHPIYRELPVHTEVILNGRSAGKLSVGAGVQDTKLLLPDGAVRDGSNSVTLLHDQPLAVSFVKAQVVDALVQAIEQYRANRWTEALKLLSEAEKTSKKKAQVFYYRGMCRLRLGDASHAVDSFNDALPLSRGNPLILQGRAEAYIRLHENHLAIQDLQKVLRTQPDNQQAKSLLSEAEKASTPSE